MIPIEETEPKEPVLLTVNVPFCISLCANFPNLALVAKSLISRAIPLIDFSSAFLMTGTYNLSSSATAIEILISLWITISSPCHVLLSNGFTFKASATAFTKNAKKVKL